MLGACAREPAPSAALPVEIATTQAQASVATLPAVVEVRQAIDEVAPAPPARRCDVAEDAVALIVRFEITSPAYYAAHLQAPVWPGEQSGVTWGVGYDGGTQTRSRITADWQQHAQAARLAGTSGVLGPPARALVPTLSDVRTPYAMAEDVFARATLPQYCELAARTFRRGWDALPLLTQGALVALIYNRGAGMQGERRREMRTLRDQCVPASDVSCIARELRSMVRIWVGTSIETGMRARYEATAALAERATRT